jgi:hypothetical protein
MTEQEAVAGMRCRGGIVARGCFVDLAQNADVAAIVDLVEQRAVAASARRRTQHQEVGAEFHKPARIARREREIGNRRIGSGGGIEREHGAATQLFIGAGITELDAARERLAAEDLDALHPRGSRRREARYG